MAAIEPVQLAASILSADFCSLGEQVEEAMKAGIHIIHVNVMDGLFVPNLGMGPDVEKALQPLIKWKMESWLVQFPQLKLKKVIEQL
jgi:ribulose-phosphate 3-epimerase